MEPYTVGIGLALSAFGAFTSFSANRKITKEQKHLQLIQSQEDGLREQGMNLDASRRQWQIAREAVAKRSAALAVATNQGGSEEGSSVLQGAFGGIFGQSGVNRLGVTQNQELGMSMFGLKGQEGQSQNKITDLQGQANTGAGLSSLGGGLMKSAGNVDKLGTYFGGKASDFLGNTFGPTMSWG